MEDKKEVLDKGIYQIKNFETDQGDFYGEIPKGTNIKVKVHVDKYKDVWRVNIREWMDKKGYKGPLKKGISLRTEDFKQILEMLNKIDLTKYQNGTEPNTDNSLPESKV